MVRKTEEKEIAKWLDLGPTTTLAKMVKDNKTQVFFFLSFPLFLLLFNVFAMGGALASTTEADVAFRGY